VATKIKELIPLENPKRDPAWQAYLDYLLEYQPAQAWALFQSKKLESLLDDRATQIANLEWDLTKQGRSRDDARETAYSEFMPSATDLPDQLPALDVQKQEILAWADKISSSPQTETT
jgi:hypothetical protein